MKKFIAILTMGFLTVLFGYGQSKQNGKLSQRPITKPVENIIATTAQLERRARSEKFCRSKNIPVYKNPKSLFVETDDKVTIRTKDEVVDRALALLYIGLKSEDAPQIYLDKLEKDFDISTKFTPQEKTYATTKKPTPQQQADANWRYEGLHVLLWALGYIDKLSYPDQMCNVAKDVKIIYDLKEQKFRQHAKLRSKKEILDQADLILRLNWACVNARTKNEPAPAKLNSEVVYESHYTLNWLINYLKQDWDSVTTDT